MKEWSMALQSSTGDAHASRQTGAERPYPITMETTGLVEQAMGELMSSLRQQATSPGAREAAAAEYDSWYPQRQRH
jgi:hypothetical protein